MSSYRVLNETEYYGRPELYSIVKSININHEQRKALQDQCAIDYEVRWSTLSQLIRYLPPFVKIHGQPIKEDIILAESCENFIYIVENEIVEPLLTFNLVKEFLLRCWMEFGYFELQYHPLQTGCNRGNQISTAMLIDRLPLKPSKTAFLKVAAYLNWCGRGCPHNDSWTDWFKAKKVRSDYITKVKDLLSQYSQSSGSCPSASPESIADSFFLYRTFETLGSPRFWRFHEKLEAKSQLLAILSLENIFIRKNDAQDIYNCWKSRSWQEFFDRLFQIGSQTYEEDHVIVHLTDLHIGKNDQTEYAERSRRLVNSIVSHFKVSSTKPYVVITGDTVDYGSSQNFDTAREILRTLRDEGFRLLITSGNHDYSDKINTHRIFAMLHAIHAATPPLSPANIASMALTGYIESYIIEGRYDFDKCSGLSIDMEAVERFAKFYEDLVGKPYQPGSLNGFEEPISSSGSNLDFIVIDVQSLETSNLLGNKLEKFFIRNNKLRLARSHLNDFQQQVLDKRIGLSGDNTLRIATCHWAVYPSKFIVWDDAAQELSMLILDTLDSSEVPSKFIRSLFTNCIRLAVLPKDQLRTFIDSIAVETSPQWIAFYFVHEGHKYGHKIPYQSIYNGDLPEH